MYKSPCTPPAPLLLTSIPTVCCNKSDTLLAVLFCISFELIIVMDLKSLENGKLTFRVDTTTSSSF